MALVEEVLSQFKGKQLVDRRSAVCRIALLVVHLDFLGINTPRILSLVFIVLCIVVKEH
jgi:hypothetical protein